MSRSGYSDDCDGWALIRWRGAVKSAIRGKRGQSFMREMLAALDALPEKRLERDILVDGNNCCAMGAVALARGTDVSQIDPDNATQVAGWMEISFALAKEIAFENDEGGHWKETPEQRFSRVRQWVVGQIKSEGVS